MAIDMLRFLGEWNCRQSRLSLNLQYGGLKLFQRVKMLFQHNIISKKWVWELNELGECGEFYLAIQPQIVLPANFFVMSLLRNLIDVENFKVV